VDVAVGSDGAVYVAVSRARPRFEGTWGQVLKYSPEGARLWAIATEGWEEGGAESLAAIAVGADAFAVAGNAFECCGGMYAEGWVRAYDLDGNLLWRNAFDAPGMESLNDGIADVAIDDAGSVYAAGWYATRRTTSRHYPGDEPLVQRIGPTGELEWAWTLEDGDPDDFDKATGIDVRDGALAVAGWFDEAWTDEGDHVPGRGWLGRFEPEGTLRWSAAWGEGRAPDASVTGVALDSDGWSLVVGTRREAADDGEDLFIRAYDADGTVQWRSALSAGSLSPNRIVADSGVFYVAADDWSKNRGLLWRFDR
jgi:hypothetical protein